MKTLKYLWIVVITISFIWLIINLLSIAGYSITNTYQVIHAEREFGETGEIVKRGKEIQDLVTHHLFFAGTNILVIITGFLSIKKLKKI